ncbi:hypothetical protein ZWY2020_035722 [Hordeum vulgare]|nr:hypothetical protein ZWY2020_035722 [Hordeum vulgare]
MRVSLLVMLQTLMLTVSSTMTSAADPVDAWVKDYRCPSTAFFYTWYEQIELKHAFLVPHGQLQYDIISCG